MTQNYCGEPMTLLFCVYVCGHLGMCVCLCLAVGAFFLTSVFMWVSACVCVREWKTEDHVRHVSLIKLLLLGNLGLLSVWESVQLLVCECVNVGVSPGLCCGLPIVSGSAVFTVVYSYSPRVVYCGSEPKLGLIPLQIPLPEKLLWWNVRQKKGGEDKQRSCFL